MFGQSAKVDGQSQPLGTDMVVVAVVVAVAIESVESDRRCGVR